MASLPAVFLEHLKVYGALGGLFLQNQQWNYTEVTSEKTNYKFKDFYLS